MNNSYFFIALLLCIALALTFFFPPVALASDDCIELFDPFCNDSNLFNGYNWRGDGFVPGMITKETHFLSAPPLTLGYATYYARGVMEATAKYMGFDLSGFVDGVAMMSCADIGQTVWIWRSSQLGWQGPFLVVDCAEWDDHYPVTVFRSEVVEVGYQTAVKWQMVENGGYDDLWKVSAVVMKSRWKPMDNLRAWAVLYRDWFKETARYYSARRVELPSRYIYDGEGQWLIEGEWRSFLAWQNNPMYIEPWIRDLIYRIGD